MHLTKKQSEALYNIKKDNEWMAGGEEDKSNTQDTLGFYGCGLVSNLTVGGLEVLT